MKKIIVALALLTLTCANARQLTQNTKSELRKLYHYINMHKQASPTQLYDNQGLNKKISHLVNKSCNESANKALNRHSLSLNKLNNIKGMIRNTCNCIAQNKLMIHGIIDSAILFKAHGKSSKQAKQAMRQGMARAKMSCMANPNY